MTRLSVQLLTLNEEAQIAGCLQSVAWADEVLVVDCFSTDNTLAICRQFPNVRVVQHAWEGFGPQRNFALSQTDATWVLALDADERVTPELRAEIEQLLASEPPQAGFWVPRVNVMGPAASVEYPPETLLRLFRRDAITFGNTGPHAAQVVQGAMGRLRHPMTHQPYRDLPHFVAKTSSYAFTVAEHMAAAGRRFSVLSALAHTLAAFFRKYLGKQGWRFGFRGLLWAALSANYTFLKYARLWELQQPASTSPSSSPAPEPPPDTAAAGVARGRPTARLSVQLLTRNEEPHIAACLQSVAWADEVLVVDCFSTDNTVAICRQFPNVRVVQHAWEGFGVQRRFALTQTDAEWILTVDSDEWVTPELQAEIQQVLATDPPQAAFTVPRPSHLGKLRPVEHPPERHLALFRRDRTAIVGEGPHLGREVDGPIGRLRHPLAHDNYRNLPHFVAKTSAYAFSVAEHMAASGRRFSSLSVFAHTLSAFLRKYLGKQGWRFGFRGLLWASLFANYTFLKYARLWELQQPAGAPQSSPAPERPPDPVPVPEPLAPAAPPASPPQTPRLRSWLAGLWPACDWKAAFILIFGVIALTFIYYHSEILSRNWRTSLFSWHLLNFLVLFVAPVLIIKLIFREPLRDYGVTLGDWRVWGKWLLLFLLVFIPVAAIASRIPQFHAYYPRYRPMLSNHWLILASMAGWLVYFFAWEFFYRGFLLFGLGKRLGAIAILIQAVPFAMTHFPKPEMESWAAILAGVALGLMAWRSKSFVGTWLLHWLAATAMDLFVVFWPLNTR